jgi:hypothetical protein
MEAVDLGLRPLADLLRLGLRTRRRFLRARGGFLRARRLLARHVRLRPRGIGVLLGLGHLDLGHLPSFRRLPGRRLRRDRLVGRLPSLGRGLSRLGGQAGDLPLQGLHAPPDLVAADSQSHREQKENQHEKDPPAAASGRPHVRLRRLFGLEGQVGQAGPLSHTTTA